MFGFLCGSVPQELTLINKLGGSFFLAMLPRIPPTTTMIPSGKGIYQKKRSWFMIHIHSKLALFFLIFVLD